MEKKKYVFIVIFVLTILLISAKDVTITGYIYAPIGEFGNISAVNMCYANGSNCKNETDPIFINWVNGINVSNSSLANYMLRTGTNSNITYLSFNTSVTPTLAEGQMAYDFNNNALSIGYPLGTTLQVGNEMYKVVTNLDSVTLPEGTPVSIVGVSGNREAIKRTNISNHTSSHEFIGLVTSANCTVNQKCLVTTFGDVHDLNTASLTEGTMLYVNSTGGLTNTIPDAPLHVIEVGMVTVSNLNNGVIALTPKINPDLSELSDVDGTPINTTGQILVWNETRKVWDATANLNNLLVGNLTQTNGNALINNIYGELYGKNDAGFYVIDLVTVDTYVYADNLTNGSINGFTWNAYNLTAQYSGLYKATAKFGVEVVSGVGGDNGMKIFVNDIGQNNCYDHEHTSATQPIGFIADCLIRVNVGDNVSIRFDDHQSPVSDLRILNGNLNLHRIGN